MSKSVSGTPRKSGIGKLFLGVFLGFVLCLGIIFGVGIFAYKNLSIQWINKTFNAGLDVGSDDLNKMTIEELISTTQSVVKNKDSYTLNDIKKDFGFTISDKLMGIDITDLKDVPIKELSTAMQDKFSNISADELKDVIDLTDMNKILNKTNTYYVYSDKLYTDENHTTELTGIEYTLTSTTVEIKGQTRNIQDDKVEFELRYLPLTKALGGFMDTMGDKITVGELVEEYNVNLPTYLYDTPEKKAKTINELTDIVNNLYLADFLGYTISGDVVTDKTGNTVTGIVAKLAKKTIQELNNVEELIQDSTIAEVLDYTYEDGTYYYSNNGIKTKVTGIMKSLAGEKVKDLTTRMNNLNLLEILDYTKYTKADGTIGYKDSDNKEVTGILTLIDLEDTTIDKISDAFEKVVKEKTLSELTNVGLLTLTEEDLGRKVPDTIANELAGRELGELKIDEASKLLSELLSE